MNTKADMMAHLLESVGVDVGQLGTPHIDVKEDNPLQAHLGEGPCTVIQFGDDVYHCMVMVQTAVDLHTTVLANLFGEVFQQGLLRNQEQLASTNSVEVAMKLASIKTALAQYINNLPAPEGSRELDLPFVVRWNVMGTVELLSAQTFISYGKKYTPEEKQEIERNFNALVAAEVHDDTTPLH